MPLAQITIVEGRSQEQIEAMAEAVTQAIADTLGAQRQAIRVAVNEIPQGHWFVAGESFAKRAMAGLTNVGAAPIAKGPA